MLLTCNSSSFSVTLFPPFPPYSVSSYPPLSYLTVLLLSPSSFVPSSPALSSFSSLYLLPPLFLPLLPSPLCPRLPLLPPSLSLLRTVGCCSCSGGWRWRFGGGLVQFLLLVVAAAVAVVVFVVVVAVVGDGGLCHASRSSIDTCV